MDGGPGMKARFLCSVPLIQHSSGQQSLADVVLSTYWCEDSGLPLPMLPDCDSATLSGSL
jgi:hypothetical protein